MDGASRVVGQARRCGNIRARWPLGTGAGMWLVLLTRAWWRIDPSSCVEHLEAAGRDVARPARPHDPGHTMGAGGLPREGRWQETGGMLEGVSAAVDG
jgi:hypothetical protein